MTSIARLICSWGTVQDIPTTAPRFPIVGGGSPTKVDAGMARADQPITARPCWVECPATSVSHTDASIPVALRPAHTRRGRRFYLDAGKTLDDLAEDERMVDFDIVGAAAAKNRDIEILGPPPFTTPASA